MSARWYVVQADERTLSALREVATEIGTLGFETLVPVAAARGWGPKRTRIWREVPAYGPFLFARFDQAHSSWLGILRLPGVSAIMAHAGSMLPHPVPERMMADVLDEQRIQGEKLAAPEPLLRKRRAEWKPMLDALSALRVA